MRNQRNRAAAFTAAGAALLAAGDVGSATAGQARASLTVTVRVVAACGGSLGTGGTVTGGAGCPAANAPMVIAAEGQAPDAGSMTTTAAVVEQFGEIRYVTLIY
jgi:hypothetical protein